MTTVAYRRHEELKRQLEQLSCLQQLLFRVRQLVGNSRRGPWLDRAKPWLVALGIIAHFFMFGQSHAEESLSGSTRLANPDEATEVAPLVEADAAAPTTLTGRILYDGTPPEQRHFQDTDSLDESLIVGKDGGIANVVIWIRSDDIPVPSVDGPLAPATVRALDRRFEPRVLAYWNAAALKIVNEAGYGINFNWQSNDPFNMPVNAAETFDAGVRKSQRFPSRLTSNIHPWFVAYILPLPHPYFAVTDDDGRFEIKNLPPGEWEFTIWHERAGPLATDRFPSRRGRFTWKVRPGENSVGDVNVAAESLGE